MADFKSGENPFASQQSDIPAGTDPFAQQPAPPATVETSEPKPFSEPPTGFFQSHPQGGVEFAQGIMATPGRVLKSLAQMAGMKKSPEFLDMASDTPKTGAGTAGAIVGDIGAAAALPFGAVSKVPALARAMQARGFLPALARAADAATTQGAIGAALSPDNQAEGAAWGAGGGVVGQGLGRVLGGIVRPTNEAQVLLDKGVALTPGQAAGKGSILNNLEQKATSIPLAGHLIESARNRGLNEANLAAVRSVADLVDKQVKLGHPPSEAIAQTRDAISKYYDAALADLTAPTMTVGRILEEGVPAIVADNPMMTAKAEKQLLRYVSGRFQQIISSPNGADMTGDMLKQLDSEIGQQIRNLQFSTNAADKTAAPAWRELQVKLREIMAGAAKTKEQADALLKANNAYRQLLVLEKSLLPGADSFTPRRLQASLEKAQGLSDTELARVSNAMNATLPNTVPDSGTTARVLANALPLLTGGIGYGALGMPIAGALLGTRTGAKAMTGSLPGQQALANALRRTTPAALRGATQDGNE